MTISYPIYSVYIYSLPVNHICIFVCRQSFRDKASQVAAMAVDF